MGTGIDFTNLPSYIATCFNMSLFPAQILTSTLLIALFTIPILYLTKGKFGIGMLVGFLILCFCVGIGWLDQWFIIMTVALVSLAVGNTAKNAFK
jgi:hypothetical protein